MANNEYGKDISLWIPVDRYPLHARLHGIIKLYRRATGQNLSLSRLVLFLISDAIEDISDDKIVDVLKAEFKKG